MEKKINVEGLIHKFIDSITNNDFANCHKLLSTIVEKKIQKKIKKVTLGKKKAKKGVKPWEKEVKKTK